MEHKIFFDFAKPTKTSQVSPLFSSVVYYKEKTAPWPPVSESKLRLFALTWNMGTKNGDGETLAQLDLAREADLVIVGTQESCNTIISSFCCNSKADWLKNLGVKLGGEHSLIADHSLNAMHLAIFATNSIIDKISDISVTTSHLGFLRLPNKAMITISFRFEDKIFTASNVHLASGKRNHQKRLADLIRICKKLARFKTDFCLLLGDFNFRSQISLAKAKSMLNYSEFDFKSLAGFDEYLSMDYCSAVQKEIDNVSEFHCFEEAGVPSFPPTYKYIRQNKLLYSDSRLPSHADRIFIIKDRNFHSTTLSYNIDIKSSCSDHKPVYAQIVLDFARILDTENSVVLVAEKNGEKERIDPLEYGGSFE